MLTWIGDQQDLPRLAELLVKPGDADKYGHDLASLPYHLVRAYGHRAVTYLERAVSESPYAFVRAQSAEELALRGRPIAYRFFLDLDALENNRFYKQELIGWLKTRFSNEVPASQHDAGVIAFLNPTVPSSLLFRVFAGLLLAGLAAAILFLLFART